MILLVIPALNPVSSHSSTASLSKVWFILAYMVKCIKLEPKYIIMQVDSHNSSDLMCCALGGADKEIEKRISGEDPNLSTYFLGERMI